MTSKEAQIIIGNIPIKPEVLDDCYSIAEYQEAKAMAIEALGQLRDCKTCKHSDNGNCAGTEECHECMWESKYS